MFENSPIVCDDKHYLGFCNSLFYEILIFKKEIVHLYIVQVIIVKNNYLLIKFSITNMGLLLLLKILIYILKNIIKIFLIIL